MFEGWKREREVRQVLRRLGRQHVGLILQPGNVWVIEQALMHDEKTDTILLTCLMRGWVEVLEQSLPRGKLTAEGNLPPGPMFDSVAPIYRVTDSGWNAINRAHEWTLIGVLIAVASLLATVFLATG